MSVDICTRRSGRDVKEERTRGKEAGDIGGGNSRRVIHKNKGGVWRI